MNEEALNNTRKRLIWRSDHRGTKEVDMLLGAFARQHVPTMDANQLSAFEEFITIPDPIMHLILTQEEPVPDGFPEDLVAAVKQFSFQPAQSV